MENQLPLIEFTADPIVWIARTPFITVRTLAQMLGYTDANPVLTIGAWIRRDTGVDPIPRPEKGKRRADCLIPLSVGMQIVAHSHSEQAKKVKAYFLEIQKGGEQ